MGFTGRVADLDAILRRLAPAPDDTPPRSPAHIAVTGMGGVGKTALTLEAAHTACSRGWFPGGAHFIDLRGYDDTPLTPEQAVLPLLDALGARGADLPTTEQWDGSSPVLLSRYQAQLARRQARTLLILDNAASPLQLVPLVPKSGFHAVLITTRERPRSLRLRTIGLDSLHEDEAAALVTNALHITNPQDDRPEREPAALRELVALCGHLPLALHIVAATLCHRRHRDIASLVAEIKRAVDPTRALDDGAEGPDQYLRPLAIRPVLQTSYARLRPEQAGALRLLAVAPGVDVSGESVAALAGTARDTAMKLLEDLEATGLVTGVASPSGPRWRLHDLVRAFVVSVVSAQTALREEGEAARTRLLAFYHAGVTAADDHVRGLSGQPEPQRFADRAAALAWLDAERAGLVEAVRWAREERHARRAVEVAESLSAYLNLRRYFDEWINVSHAALEAAQQAADRPSEATAWDSLGNAYREVDRIPEAIEAHDRAQKLFREIGNRRREALAWNNRGIALQKRDRTAEAIDALEHARDLCQEVGDLRREATCWNNLGAVLLSTRRVDEAITAHTRALALSRETHDLQGEGIALNNLGHAMERGHRPADAKQAYADAAALLKDIEDWYRAGQTLQNLAMAHERALERDRARAAYLEAAEAFTRAKATKDAAHCQSCAHALT
ncbi:tetratricopeptide repeat protein [Streptomyces sp. NPDC002589]|uniref:tetratricopeptide repeat protein n=1 Tax=Streptomyces sp. NPDC002589 TaxID=3154420 RepID=UPI00331B0DF7